MPIEQYEKLKKKCDKLEAAIQTIHVASEIWRGDEGGENIDYKER